MKKKRNKNQARFCDALKALSIVPPKERTIQQLAQIKIFEVSQPIRSQCGLLQSQLEELTENFAAQSKTLQCESEKAAKCILENGVLENRVKKFETELKDARELVARNHEKGQKFDKTSQGQGSKLFEIKPDGFIARIILLMYFVRVTTF